MRLFFDARYLRTDFHDGVSRYSAELGNALAAITDVTFIICDTRQLKWLPKGADYIRIHSTTSAKEPLTSLILNRYKPDVVFSPMQTMGSLGRRFKLILTLHDMIYYLHRTPPPYLNAFIRLAWRAYHMSYTPQRLTLNSADIVATVSETSKKDFEKVYLTKRPIIVVPNAPRDLSQFLTAKPDPRRPLRSLVFMGSFMRYKNVETIIRSLEYLPGYTLHLLSRIKPDRQRQLESIAPAGAKVVFHNGVSDEEYAEILRTSIYVTASRAEGYGLPIAEALGIGVPSVVSNIAIHHEVAGDGALYFPADDPKILAERVRQLESEEVRRTLSVAGQSHIKQFSWQKSAQTLLEAVTSLAASRDKH